MDIRCEESIQALAIGAHPKQQALGSRSALAIAAGINTTG
jgi:hypothetical protein